MDRRQQGPIAALIGQGPPGEAAFRQLEPGLRRQGALLGPQGRHHILEPTCNQPICGQAQPFDQGLGPGGEQGRALAQALQALEKLGACRLVEVVDLGDIEGLLQHRSARGNQHQVVVDQGRRQGHRGLTSPHKGTAAADQAHAAVGADLQVGA